MLETLRPSRRDDVVFSARQLKHHSTRQGKISKENALSRTNKIVPNKYIMRSDQSNLASHYETGRSKRFFIQILYNISSMSISSPEIPASTQCLQRNTRRVGSKRCLNYVVHCLEIIWPLCYCC
ncbi:hypothetical protein M5689_000482 [Euphorbia peplus]|nr:hypothetical protein M5689_000482 [Euphorbia peplus]